MSGGHGSGFREEFSIAQIADVAVRVADGLRSSERFCLWLRGDLGAGKTTFVRHILYQLGLPPSLPVPSPTFAYMHEYNISDQWFAHLDLYRADGIDLLDLGIVGVREYAGYFVEWPDRLTPGELMATHELDLTVVGHDVRHLDFRWSACENG